MSEAGGTGGIDYSKIRRSPELELGELFNGSVRLFLLMLSEDNERQPIPKTALELAAKLCTSDDYRSNTDVDYEGLAVRIYGKLVNETEEGNITTTLPHHGTLPVYKAITFTLTEQGRQLAIDRIEKLAEAAELAVSAFTEE